VTTELGLPTFACEEPTSIAYELPLRVTTSDTRVNIYGLARASAGFDGAGALNKAWFEIYHSDPSAPGNFASSSGIAGVNLDGLAGARWYTDTYLQNEDASPPRGSVTVEGVDAQGLTTGVVDQLTWSLK
jgi:hypothetical protein